jgi:hypothetical protein
MDVIRSSSQPSRCAMCHQRLTLETDRIRFRNVVYHEHCFRQWWREGHRRHTPEESLAAPIGPILDGSGLGPMTGPTDMAPRARR